MTNLMPPLVESCISAGFPSPAENYFEEPLDLNSFLIQNPPATFFIKVSGKSMEPEIIEGDILLVDKSANVRNNDIVIAEIDGEFTLKRFFRQGNSALLIPDNKCYPTITLFDSTDSDLRIWGKVMSIIRKY